MDICTHTFGSNMPLFHCPSTALSVVVLCSIELEVTTFPNAILGGTEIRDKIMIP